MPLLTSRGSLDRVVAHRFEGDLLSIGRSVANDLVLRGDDVSRRHAELRRAGSGWMLVDLGSRHGTWLNGRRVESPERLATGDVVRCGTVELVFDALAADGEPTDVTRAGAARAAEGDLAPELVGESEPMRRLRGVIERVAHADATVLILGEPGTGKELVARQLHARSPRASGPFVVVNCPALPAGLVESELFGVERGVATGVERRAGRLELADGGTLVLDEIGDLDAAAQAKLLRFLEDRLVERVGARRPVALDVRIVASTNRDLDAAVRAGAFRADLLHRLAVVVVRLPPLRERATDVPLIVEHALSRRPGPRRRFAPDALDALAARPWPGNVRELLNVVERACLLSDADPLEPADLGDESLERQAGDPAAVAENLRRRILDEGGSFWEIVRGPYLRRELPRDAVRLFIERAWLDSGRSYKEMARRLGIEKDHKKLLNFLWTQDLGVTRDEE